VVITVAEIAPVVKDRTTDSARDGCPSSDGVDVIESETATDLGLAQTLLNG
jgi:hypothetical protein